MNVLFVCTGNTCRSPMAMGIFNLLAERNDVAAHATSCGIAAYPAPASEYAVEAAREHGADISSHIACQVTEEMIKNADRVYGMAMGHVRTLQNAFPQFAGKIFPLADRDVRDPYGGSLDEYREAARQIRSAVEDVLQSIKEAQDEED